MPSLRESRLRRASPYLLAGVLAISGTLHFLTPRPFVGIVPPQLPAPYTLVYVSGAAELACAVGLAMPRTRRIAGWATAALFLVVFPANIQMAIASGEHPHSVVYRALTWLRLPVQLPLIAWAVTVSRRATD